MKNVQAYKTIGEVAKIIKVESHVLRFWEENYSQIKPLKRKGGRRLYSEEDINLLRTIKKLIHNDGFTVKEVKKYLSKNKLSTVKREGMIKISEELDNKLSHIHNYLATAKKILNNESK